DYIDRKHGRKKVTFGHDVLKPILEPTYGVIVYQEQVMRIAVDLSGFTMGEADKLRKAMGKKKEDVMAKMQHQFVEGAYTINGMPREQSNALFEQIKKFAGYAFNKSHSAAYAVISYQTAFLKKYYPVEFTAALLSTEMGTQDSVVKYITSARQNGINVLPPDVNRSERDFSVVREDDGTASILFGLGAVKGVGDAAIESIINARRESPMSSLFDFCERVDMRKVNRKVLDALVKSGACDGFNRPRSQLFDAIGRALEAGSSAQKDRLSGQTSLFSAFAAADTSDSASTVTETYADIDEWKDKERLSREKEALGFYVSGHPLDSFAKDLPRLATHTSEAFVQLKKAGSSYKAEYSLGGIVTGYNEKMTKKGDRIAFFNIEDMYGSVEVKAFTKVFAEYGFLLKMDEPLLITGAAGFGDSKGGDDTGEDIATVLRANKIQLLSDARAAQANRVEINVPVYALDNQKLIRLKEILVANSGTTPANLTVTDPDVSETVIDLPENLQVNPTEELLYRVDQLFGEKVIRLG
ncbi:DNA polymerase III subunit alpha, partial [Myxococcota bacterium]|nr:DNA polymerase III subunit alpha [Myxococcota bacterium]